MDSKKLIEQARERFKVASEAEEKQRHREKADLEFLIPEKQWDDKDRAARENRPTVSISKLDQPRQLLLNQMRQADLGINIHPVSEQADTETAEMLQGLYRDIERRSRAELARYWGYDRAVACGRGAYRVITEYDDESDTPTDQRIAIKRIYHQDGVYFDPAANEPDYSDGNFVFIVRWLSAEQFETEFPDAKAAPAERLSLEQFASEAPEWVRDEDFLVAEYWWRETEAQKKGPDKVTVKTCKLCGWEILEKEQDWLGKYIPIIPVIGREIQPFDSERRYVGMIGPAKDGQKLYNYAASTLIERMSLEPKAPFIAAAEAVEGYEDMWKTANTKNWPVLFFNARNAKTGAEMLTAPQRAQVDSSGMSVAILALQEADQFIQSTTFVYDQTLGRGQKDESGRKVLALQGQSDAATGGWLQSLADVSMTYEAKVVLDLIPKIYDRAGRVVRIVRGDDRETAPAMLGMPYVMDPSTKRPMPAPIDPRTKQPLPQKGVKQYDLKKGVYGVAVSVGKSFQTRLQEGNEQIGQILTAKPELMPIIGDIYFRFQDFPGAKEIAKRLAKVREQQMPGLGEGDEGEMSPEQLQAENQRLKGQVQQMGQQIQAASQAIETDKAKQEATVAKAQIDNQTELRKAEMDNSTRMQVAQLSAQVQLAIAEMKAAADQMKASMAARQADEQRGHEREMGDRTQRHETMMAVAGPALEEPEQPRAGGAE